MRSAEWILAPLHRQWFESILWYVGEHYVEFNPRSRRFQTRPAPQHIPRSVTNLILGYVESAVAMLEEALPARKVVSETREDRDRAAAEVAQGALRYRDEVVQMELKKHDAALWTVVCGQAYLQALEDRSMAERVRIPLMEPVLEPLLGPDGVPVLGPDGQPAMVEKEHQARTADGQPAFDEVTLVDENVELLSPFEIIPDWTARHPSEFRRYTHFRARAREWIGRAFGSEAKKKVKSEQGIGLLAYYHIKVLDIITRSASMGRFGLPTSSGGAVSDWRWMEDSCIVKARYMLPTDEMPDGRLMIVAGGEILHDGKYPYGDKLNLFTMRWHPVPGSLFGLGMVRNLIMPQKRLNGIDTQVDVVRKIGGNPQWLAAKGTQFDVELGSSKPGYKFTYKHRAGFPPPSRLNPVEAPRTAHEQRDRVVADMERISGMLDVLRGQKPPGVEAGVAIDALSELAGKRFNPIVRTCRAALVRLDLCRLEIMRRSNAWAYPRPVPLVGDDGEREIKQFQATDFEGNITVTIEAVPMVAFSSALKLQKFDRAVGLGIIDLRNSPVNREKARVLLNVSEFEEEYTLDYKRAQMENEVILAGGAVARQKFDDDVVHLMVLMQIIKSRRWDKLPRETQDAALAHAAEHTTALELAAAERMKQQQDAAAREAALRVSGAPGAGAEESPAAGAVQ